jgi:hypothetical protein
MSEWKIETSIPAETRAERRERIAVAIMAGLAGNSECDPNPVAAARVAIEWTEMLICALEDAARKDAKGGVK